MTNTVGKMNDPSGVPSPFGIEVVEWFSEGGENLTVRVTGRWRRRRPAWSAQPTLVVEAPGRRYRFRAMPEPPSLSGTPPGKWRISFAVPAALAPELGGRAWLQFGAVAVPLPTAVEPLGATSLAAAAVEAEPEAPERPASDVEAPLAGDAPSEPSRASSELGDEVPRLRPAESEEALARLSVRVQTLESDLAQARAEAERLSSALTSEQLSGRAAEQHAHAERAQRLELARELTERSSEVHGARQALGDLAASEERVRGLEFELAAARRRIDEAEQVAAAATSARERAERAAAEAADNLLRRAAPSGAGTARVEQERLGIEHALIARRAGGASRVPSEPSAAAVAADTPPVLEEVRPPAATADDELLAAMRGELHQRARSEAALRARLVESETRIAARQLLERQTAATLRELRDELGDLKAMFTRERAAREMAERRAEALERDLARLRLQTGEAHAAIAELRGVIESLRAVVTEAAPSVDSPATPADDSPATPADDPPGTPADDSPATPADDPFADVAEDPVATAEPAERLSEALVRLRDAIAPLDTAAAGSPSASAPAVPTTADRAWLRPVFAALARTVPDRAGRLLVDLLPAQQAVDPTPVAYDLMLGKGLGCVRVTVDDHGSRVVLDDEPRPRGDVDFRISGDYAALAKLIAAGRVRRRLGWGVARVRGKQRRLPVLDALLDTRLRFGGLYAAGVRMHARTALTVVAELIEPAWTDGASFVLGYESPPEKAVYLVVAGGAAVAVSDAPPQGKAATRISGPAGSLELLLAGRRDEATLVIGEDEPLTLLREWINRAQSG